MGILRILSPGVVEEEQRGNYGMHCI